jgi:hypothetical protein
MQLLQAAQLAAPDGDQLPGLHAAQLVAPAAEKVPAAQEVHDDALLATLVKVPALHRLQTVLLDAVQAWLAKRPAGQVEQLVQADAPAAE